MTNANPSRLGQTNLAGDPLALFLKIFGGMVMEANDRVAAFDGRHFMRTITSGKSAQFPALGLASVGYHTPGQELLGTTIRHAERVINVEDFLVSDSFIADIDDLMNHIEMSSRYAHAMGEAMGKFFDQNVARTFVNAARTTAAITGLADGYSITDADFDTDGNKLYAGIYNSGVRLDQNDIPQTGRYSWLDPIRHALVVRSEKPINRDLNDPNGSIATGSVGQINSIPIIKTNNMPTADDRTNALMPARRQHDYSTVRAIVGHGDAVGTVVMQGLTMSAIPQPQKLGMLLIAKRLAGHDVLRADGAVELRTAAPAG